jgi:hypothetical protein
MDASGRTEADSSRLDAGRVDTGRPDTGRDGHWMHWTPHGRTPDGWTARPGRTRTVDTTWWTRTGDQPTRTAQQQDYQDGPAIAATVGWR